MKVKPHWHHQAVVRNPEAGTQKNPYGPVVRYYEVQRWAAYETRREARYATSLSHKIVVRCDNPTCAPGAGKTE